MTITAEHYIAMQAVESGADVYSRPIAERLRHVKSKMPGWIFISEPQAYDGDGTDQVPYFGAMLTKEGRQAVEMFFREG